jgi:hypothetical protein
MFTKISSTLASVLVGINRSTKHHDPDICLLKNDRAALAYLQMRPTRGRPSADFGLSTGDVW